MLSIGYETFLPLRKELKIWKNRQRKFIETPLFSNYIFINTFQSEIFNINKIRGICRCVTCAKKPVSISDNDIMSLKIMQEMDVMAVENKDFILGDRIHIINGVLCGYEGVLIKVKGLNKFAINIECINLTAIVDVDVSNIQKIKY